MLQQLAQQLAYSDEHGNNTAVEKKLFKLDSRDLSRVRKPKICIVLHPSRILIYLQLQPTFFSHCSKFSSSIFFKYIFFDT